MLLISLKFLERTTHIIEKIWTYKTKLTILSKWTNNSVADGRRVSLALVPIWWTRTDLVLEAGEARATMEAQTRADPRRGVSAKCRHHARGRLRLAGTKNPTTPR